MALLTLPPEICIVAVPERPSSRLPLFAQVPLLTVTVPFDPWLMPTMLAVAVNWPPERLIVPVEVLAMTALAAVPETPVPKSTVRLASMIAVPLAVGTAPPDQLPPMFQVPDATVQVTTSPHTGRIKAPIASTARTATAVPRAAGRLRYKQFMTWPFVGRRFCRPGQRMPATTSSLRSARTITAWKNRKARRPDSGCRHPCNRAAERRPPSRGDTDDGSVQQRFR